EQARVLDRDHALPGEIGDQLDLLVGEDAWLAPAHAESTDALLVPEHRHRKHGADAGIRSRDRQRFAVAIGLALQEILDLSSFPRDRRPHDRRIGSGMEPYTALPLRGEALRPFAVESCIAE